VRFAVVRVWFVRLSKRIQIKCPKWVLIGGPQMQGGWDVCIAKPYNLVPPCLVYSIGYIILIILIIAPIHYCYNSELKKPKFYNIV